MKPSFENYFLWDALSAEQKTFFSEISKAHRFTFQEFRQVLLARQDFEMWKHPPLENWWTSKVEVSSLKEPHLKKDILASLQEKRNHFKKKPTVYGKQEPLKGNSEEKTFRSKTSSQKIHGLCPVASEKTVCCNLRTIDVASNCVFGCSYCAIQTFQGGDIIFDNDFIEKLHAIPIEEGKYYHFCTGQSSDSLAFGNRRGHLTALCEFAANHPSILLEFKTKSDKIDFFSTQTIPKNVVCSWSLNTPIIIANEEVLTANLDSRLAAARKIADLGIKVAFHFHPMIHYEGWKQDYAELAERVMAQFCPEEVLFLSFGTVTLTKSVIRQIRKLGRPTKILQMPMVSDPHGKQTYPDEIKLQLFRNMRDQFVPWKDQVFQYLCMEKASIWDGTYGFHYESNEAFERDFGEKVM